MPPSSGSGSHRNRPVPASTGNTSQQADAHRRPSERLSAEDAAKEAVKKAQLALDAKDRELHRMQQLLRNQAIMEAVPACVRSKPMTDKGGNTDRGHSHKKGDREDGASNEVNADNIDSRRGGKEKGRQEKSQKAKKSNTMKSGEPAGLAEEIRHRAHLFQFEEYPFLSSAKFLKVKRPSFSSLDPIQFESNNSPHFFSAILFNFFPNKWHSEFEDKSGKEKESSDKDEPELPSAFLTEFIHIARRHRGTSINSIRKISSELFNLPSTVFGWSAAADQERRNREEVWKGLLGLPDATAPYSAMPLMPPLLFKDLDSMNKPGLFLNPVLFQIGRIVIYGSSMYKHMSAPIRKGSAFKSDFASHEVTPGSISWCCVVAIHLFSKDKEFQSPGQGENSEIKYCERFETYRQIIIKASKEQPKWHRRVMKTWQKQLYPKSADAGDDDDDDADSVNPHGDEIADMLAGLTIDDDDMDEESSDEGSSEEGGRQQPADMAIHDQDEGEFNEGVWGGIQYDRDDELERQHGEQNREAEGQNDEVGGLYREPAGQNEQADVHEGEAAEVDIEAVGPDHEQFRGDLEAEQNMEMREDQGNRDDEGEGGAEEAQQQVQGTAEDSATSGSSPSILSDFDDETDEEDGEILSNRTVVQRPPVDIDTSLAPEAHPLRRTYAFMGEPTSPQEQAIPPELPRPHPRPRPVSKAAAVPDSETTQQPISSRPVRSQTQPSCSTPSPSLRSASPGPSFSPVEKAPRSLRPRRNAAPGPAPKAKTRRSILTQFKRKDNVLEPLLVKASQIL
ncbi:hypothetical protein CPB84DRAFT_1827079 [Gymnopilus junonius]|uniref:Uncharacterized protein n=1 Tax=Gymnopilus junonius TaxID=109634 RepID=A0A9P5NEX8_GYMJU|nr:hypothetical protein CPB84DRAFT_1827079 [Gymnopilus junonius]